ncbi:hypothetical protein P9112_007803 [Eukaryota sp. TZLM1-RC]
MSEDCRQLLHQTLVASPSYIIILSSSLNIVDISEGYSWLMAYDREELIGLYHSVLIHPDYLSATSQAASRLFSDTETRTLVNKNITKKGEVVSLMWSFLCPVGDNLAFVCQAFDEAEFQPTKHTIGRMFASADSMSRLTEMLAKTSGLGMFVYDVEFELFYWNQVLWEMFKLNQDSFVNNMENFLSLVTEETRSHLSEGFCKAIHEGTPFVTTVQVIDGNWFEIEGKVEFEDGKPISIYGIVKDVTEDVKKSVAQTTKIQQQYDLLEELQAAKAELTVTTEELKQAQAIAKVGRFVVDLDKMEISYNDMGAKLVNLTEGSVLSIQEQLELMETHSAETFLTSIQQCRETKSPFEMEASMEVNGTTLHLLAKGEPASITKLGEVKQIVGTVQDITTLKQKDIELSRSRALFSDILDCILDAVIVFDERGLVLFNDHAYKLFNFDAVELASLSELLVYLARKLNVVDPSSFQRLSDPSSEFRQTRFSIDSKDGKSYDVFTTVLDQASDSTLRVLTLRDITELKSIEKMLTKKTEEAESANKAKGSFVQTMSHELRTPLNSIIGMISVLETTELPEKVSSIIETISKASRLLLNLTCDILDFSKIESSRLELDQQEFNLTDIIDNTLILIAESFVESFDVELTLFIDPVLDRIFLGDPQRLQQIVLILLSNAMKFTEKGHVHIHLSLLNDESDKAKFRLEVSDTGIGIKQEDISRLFLPFEQIKGSKPARKYSGTGLGIPITCHLLQLMNSKLNIESEVDKGSRFLVSNDSST